MRVLPLVTLLLAGNVAAAEPPGATSALIAERIARFHGTMGVAAIDLGGSGETLAVGAERRFPTASIIKLAVLVEAFQQVEGGTLRLDQLVTVEPADRVGDGGIVDRIHQGASLSLQDLLNLMIRLSDNSATNAVVRLVGTAKVDERLAAYGLKDTLLFRPTFRDGHPDVHPELEKEFGLGMTTPRDIAALMAKIGRGEAVSPAASKAMLEILEGQEDKLMIYRGLPHAATEGGIRVASKTGWDEEKLADASGKRGDVRGDVALVTGPGFRYVLAILARHIEDKSPTADNEAFVAGAEISRLVYQHFAKASR